MKDVSPTELAKKDDATGAALRRKGTKDKETVPDEVKRCFYYRSMMPDNVSVPITIQSEGYKKDDRRQGQD